MHSKKIVIYVLFGFIATFSELNIAAGISIIDCSISSLTDGGDADSCGFGTKKTGVGNGDLNTTTLNGISGGGWGTAPALKSDARGSKLTLAGAPGTNGTWTISSFDISDFFAPQIIDTNFLLDALFVIKAGTAFEWFVFEPLTATLSGDPVLLNASGGWSTQDFFNSNNKDPKISHLSVYFRQNESGGDLPGEVPLPAAVWLFGSGLAGLIGFARHKNGRRMA